MNAATLLPTHVIVDDLDRWVREDGIDEGDITTEVLVEVGEHASMRLVAREDLVVCGLEPVVRGLEALDCGLTLQPAMRDGDTASVGEALGTLSGERRAILGFERTILNLLGRLCGVATCTRRFVDAIAGTDALITDTRKTMPGLRLWDKYAVLRGGGISHRTGLHDAALFKDNHFAGMSPVEMAAALSRAIAAARADRSLAFVEVEVDTLEQLDAVLPLPGLDIILLDNMPPEVMREAVTRRDDVAPAVKLEASGGITLDTVRAAAESGVDRIAVGAITRDATILDIGLDA